MPPKKEWVQDKILEVLAKKGKDGLHVNKLVRSVKCGVGTLYNRLSLLEAAGKVKSESRIGKGATVVKIYRIVEVRK